MIASCRCPRCPSSRAVSRRGARRCARAARAGVGRGRARAARARRARDFAAAEVIDPVCRRRRSADRSRSSSSSSWSRSSNLVFASTDTEVSIGGGATGVEPRAPTLLRWAAREHGEFGRCAGCASCSWPPSWRGSSCHTSFGTRSRSGCRSSSCWRWRRSSSSRAGGAARRSSLATIRAPGFEDRRGLTGTEASRTGRSPRTRKGAESGWTSPNRPTTSSQRTRRRRPVRGGVAWCARSPRPRQCSRPWRLSCCSSTGPAGTTSAQMIAEWRGPDLRRGLTRRRQAGRVACDTSGRHVGVVSHADGVAEVGGRLAYLTPEPATRSNGWPCTATSCRSRRPPAQSPSSRTRHGICAASGTKSRTECFALQSGVRVARRLGLGEDTARRMMRSQLVANQLHGAATAEYVVGADCANRGPLDLRPSDDVFP